MNITSSDIANFVMALVQVGLVIVFLSLGFVVMGIKVADIPFWRYLIGLFFLYIQFILIFNFKWDWSEE